MEDEMREFYGSHQNGLTPTSSPTSGQLVAVRAEEEEVLRAQICDILPDKVKVSSEERKVIEGEKWREIQVTPLLLVLQVYFVDHGFSEVISNTKVFELHEKFVKLPFQATTCRLAGESLAHKGDPMM